MSQLLTVFKIKFTLQYPGRFPLTSHHAYLFLTRYILAILAFVKVFQCSMLFSPSRTFYMFFPLLEPYPALPPPAPAQMSLPSRAVTHTQLGHHAILLQLLSFMSFITVSSYLFVWLFN